MSITIGSNIAALRTQRKLGDTSSTLAGALERLSSGQRINRASDDAAGLAIASSLRTDARVFSQGVRNLNDAISYLNIAVGAAQELKTILFRQRELSTQASNGPYGDEQRGAMDAEVQALTSEYNRILEATRFNGQAIFSSADASIVVQAGYGTEGTLTAVLGSTAIIPDRTVGTGTFGAEYLLQPGVMLNRVAAADLSGDSAADIVTLTTTDSRVFIGNGNGTFRTRTIFATEGENFGIALSDVNGDSILDMAAANRDLDCMSVLIGNGNGTFLARTSFATEDAPRSIAALDMNGDLKIDIVTANTNSVSVLLGNGNGTFAARSSFAMGSASYSVALSDVNGDSLPDIVAGDMGVQRIAVLIGNGNGTFQARASFTPSGGPLFIAVQDLNGDSKADVVSADLGSGTINVLLGNGNGTFAARNTYAGAASALALLDINGDAKVDMATADSSVNRVGVFIGNGNGTFAARSSYTTGNGPSSVALSDLNGDSAPDIVSADVGAVRVGVFLATATTIPGSVTTTGLQPLAGIAVATRPQALLAQESTSSRMEEVSAVMGVLGASMSRLQVAISTMSSKIENVHAAEGRIIDADMAQESAVLLRSEILQQAGAAVLGQANQQPALALRLLQSG